MLRRVVGRSGPFRLTRVLVTIFISVGVLSSCTSDSKPDARASTATARVAALRSISDLKDQFNEDSGKTRLVLLISPT